MDAYTVTVNDHPAQDTHVAPQPFATITAAKGYAADLLHRIYADPPRSIAAEVSDAVENLIARIHIIRGPLTEHDPYLDCTVEILKVSAADTEAERQAHRAAVAASLARVVKQDADILNELGTQ